MRLAVSFALVGSLLAAVPVVAQGRGRPADTVPAAHRPPPGMCRIWLLNVPPSKQAAPTDCATAVRNRSANGLVVFGDTAVSKRAPALPPVQRLAPPPATKTKAVPPPPKPPKPPPDVDRR